jgi:hypothetical protein
MTSEDVTLAACALCSLLDVPAGWPRVPRYQFGDQIGPRAALALLINATTAGDSMFTDFVRFLSTR